MTTFISSLPVRDNNGHPITRNVQTTIARLRSQGVSVVERPGAYGMWYGDDGRLYEEEVVLVLLTGREGVIKRELAAFGEATAQLAMLCVKAEGEFVAGTGNGKRDAALLAKAHGGATLLPDGTAVSLVYDGLDASEYRRHLA